MLERLQKKWKVSPWRLVLILITFAVGGSLTGLAGRRVMQFTGIDQTVPYIIVYIILVTLIWPFMVLIVSIPLGQFLFFRGYLKKMGRRFKMKKEQINEPVKLPEAPIPGKPETKNQKHITLFASGAGSNAQKIIDHFRNTSVIISLIVCNKPQAGVIEIAKKENIPFLIIDKDKFFRGDGYVPELESANTSLVVLAGFLWKIPSSILNRYRGRIINIHPALLPKFGGKGMYGSFVHEAVVQAGEMQSGITIHYVDEHYDNGDIIFQTACPVLEGDTPEKLAQRIHQLEHLHFPRVIEEVLEKMDTDRNNLQ